MKKNIYLVLWAVSAVFFLQSCSDKSDLADAYGNFDVIKTVISSQGNGQLLLFTVNDGQEIKKGELLGQIDTLALHLQKEQLKAQKIATLSGLNDIDAQLAVFEQQRVSVQINKDRIDRLFKDKAATQKQVDDIQAQLDLIAKQKLATKTKKSNLYDQVKVIDKQIDLLKLSIQNCIIISPVDGIVLNTLARQGEMTGIGKPLFSIANLDVLELKVYVSGQQLPLIRLGEVADVYIDKNASENKKYSGKVSWISETAEFTPKTIQTKAERVNLVYAVKLLVANDGSLKIGMPGEVIFPSIQSADDNNESK